MYLAKRVGRWSLSQIGRFYNGRHHTTVLHAIEKIETLRRTDESIDALIDVLTAALSPDLQTAAASLPQSSLRSVLIEAVAARVYRPARWNATGQWSETRYGSETSARGSSMPFTSRRSCRRRASTSI